MILKLSKLFIYLIIIYILWNDSHFPFFNRSIEGMYGIVGYTNSMTVAIDKMYLTLPYWYIYLRYIAFFFSPPPIIECHLAKYQTVNTHPPAKKCHIYLANNFPLRKFKVQKDNPVIKSSSSTDATLMVIRSYMHSFAEISFTQLSKRTPKHTHLDLLI